MVHTTKIINSSEQEAVVIQTKHTSVVAERFFLQETKVSAVTSLVRYRYALQYSLVRHALDPLTLVGRQIVMSWCELVEVLAN